MFDPFKDFDTAGYLRNFAAEKDLDIVKAAEHELFRANLPEVVHHLATLTQITYADFCQVHKILFQGLYPWAGQDRSLTAPDSGDVAAADAVPVDLRAVVPFWIFLTMRTPETSWGRGRRAGPRALPWDRMVAVCTAPV